MNIKAHARLARSSRQIVDWAEDDLPVRIHKIESYAEGKEIVIIACHEVFATGMNEIGKSLQLASPRTSFIASKTIAAANMKMLVANSINVQSMRSTTRTHFSDLDSHTSLMLRALATGQFGLVAPLHRAVFDGLENGYGVRDGHNLPLGTTLRYAAFGLSIIGDWLGKPLDLDKHALPRDPAWGQLVAHWRAPDPETILPILLAACDTHVERIALTSRELDSGRFEFGSPFEAVYPAEILAIINLRRSLGLTTPFIDHPLMKTPYAALTLPPGTLLERDDLLMRFLDAVRRYDPEAMPEGLYEAVSSRHEES